MKRCYGLTIIGAGPVDVNAAIHRSRVGLKTAVLEMDAPGRKLIRTAEISNRSGIIETSGVKLASDMLEHSTSFSAEYLYGNAIRVGDSAYKKIVCEDGTKYETKAVIVATGAQECIMNVSGELENVGRGISYCAVCDGAFFRDQEVVVTGGGNSALEEANYLTWLASKVDTITRRDVFRADSIVQSAIRDNPEIMVMTEHVPVCVVDDGIRVTGLVIRSADTNVETEMKTHGMFPYIGLDPVTSSLRGPDILDECGYAIVDENCKTKAKGIYGAGDVIARKLRQVVTAANGRAITTQHAFCEIKGI